jgi:hypothetical protein
MNANDHLSAAADVDRLLAAFFEDELPDPFPAMKRPAAQVEPAMPATSAAALPQRHAVLTQGRFALAVSVAMLLGGCWYISGQIGGPPERPLTVKDGGGATLPKVIQKAKEEHKPPTMP